MTERPERVTVVYAAPPGSGGLGLVAQQALESLGGQGREVHALGPPSASGAQIATPSIWYQPPAAFPEWAARYTPLRWRAGERALRQSRCLGQWAEARIREIDPIHVYAFTEVALESLRWSREHDVRTVLDSPTGHIRHFSDVIRGEAARWFKGRSLAHPTLSMVERVEEEYTLADRIRAPSRFARDSMVERGIPADRIEIIPYGVDVRRFLPAPVRPAEGGPLRVCFVGMLALHKGFAYLLRAARLVGSSSISIRLVGGTVDRKTRRLLDEERRGLTVVSGPADDLVGEMQRSEILVLPSLHDGFGLVVAEAMAAGLPVIVTNRTGAADWVEPGVTGWIVEAGSEIALATALHEAMERRADLVEMGRAARAVAVARTGTEDRLRAWVFGETQLSDSSGRLR